MTWRVSVFHERERERVCFGKGLGLLRAQKSVPDGIRKGRKSQG